MVSRPLLAILPAELWDKIFEDTLDDWQCLRNSEKGRRTLNDQITMLRQISKQHAVETPFIKQLSVHARHMAFAYPPSLTRLAQTTRYAANFIDFLDVPSLEGDNVSRRCLRLRLNCLALTHIELGVVHFLDMDPIWSRNSCIIRNTHVSSLSQIVLQAQGLATSQGQGLQIRFQAHLGDRRRFESETYGTEYSEFVTVTLQHQSQSDRSWQEIDFEESRHMHLCLYPAIFESRIRTDTFNRKRGTRIPGARPLRSSRVGKVPWPCDCDITMAEYVDWIMAGQRMLENHVRGTLLRQVPAWD